MHKAHTDADFEKSETLLINMIHHASGRDTQSRWRKRESRRRDLFFVPPKGAFLLPPFFHSFFIPSAVEMEKDGRRKKKRGLKGGQSRWWSLVRERAGDGVCTPTTPRRYMENRKKGFVRLHECICILRSHSNELLLSSTGVRHRHVTSILFFRGKVHFCGFPLLSPSSLQMKNKDPLYDVSFKCN